jgi:hypothetical protein
MIWISVKDKLPELYQWVLVCDSPKGTGEPRCINICRHDGKTWEMVNYEGLDWIDSPTFSDIIYHTHFDEITHWMPLPFPPQDLEKECNETGHMYTWFPKNKSLCMRCGEVNDDKLEFSR